MMVKNLSLYLILLGLTGSLLAEVIVSESASHALISAERHEILAPGSSRDFRPPQIASKPSLTGTWARPDWRAARELPLIEDELPSNLYRLTASPEGWILKLKARTNVSSVIALSPSYLTGRGRIAWALRSSEPIGNRDQPYILSHGRLLGPENNLHFIASSLTKTDQELGEIFELRIPQKAVYGYWETGLREQAILKGSQLRVRFFGLAYGYQGAKSWTYRIPIR